MTLPDFFDVNGPGSDSHLQFMNWTVDNNGAWDYAADTRGYTVGGMAEYDDRSGAFATASSPCRSWPTASTWTGPSAAPTARTASSSCGTVSFQSAKARSACSSMPTAPTWALIARRSTPFWREPTRRPTSCFTSTSARSSTASATTPSRKSPRICASLAASDGTRASTSPSPTPRSTRPWRPARDYAGTRWHRPVDKIGLAVVSNAIKADHQEYLKLGGLGFLLGDGKLNYGRENIVESYYNWHVVARLVLCARRAAHRQPRIQPRPRPSLGGFGARACGFLRHRSRSTRQ
jgi:high affinity Mn2+ porin